MPFCREDSRGHHTCSYFGCTRYLLGKNPITGPTLDIYRKHHPRRKAAQGSWPFPALRRVSQRANRHQPHP